MSARSGGRVVGRAGFLGEEMRKGRKEDTLWTVYRYPARAGQEGGRAAGRTSKGVERKKQREEKKERAQRQ